jgi:hypothetical protein
MCYHKDSLLVYCHKSYYFHIRPQTLDTLLLFMCCQKCWLHYFLYTVINPIIFHVLPQTLYSSLLSCASTKTLCWFTATNPITFHLLPQTIDSVTFHMLPEMLTVTFCILPQMLLLSKVPQILTLYIFPYTATNVDSFVLGGYTVCVTRFGPKLKPRGAQRMVTIVYCVAPGTYHPHICCLHHHHQNHQHLLKVQVIRVDILEGGMTFWIEACAGRGKLSVNWNLYSVEGCLFQKV